MTTVVATGAVLCGAAVYHSKRSATGRVNKISHDADQAQALHEDILSIAAPQLRMVEGGQDVIDHSAQERFELWR